MQQNKRPHVLNKTILYLIIALQISRISFSHPIIFQSINSDRHVNDSAVFDSLIK